MTAALALDSELAALLGAVLATSFLGSLHCVGMCGPLVASSVSGGCSRGAAAGAQTLYHLGRLTTLALLGALCGLLGAGVTDLGQWIGVQRIAAIGTGLVLAAWGGLLLWRGEGFHLELPGGIGQRVGAALRAVSQLPTARRALLIGALTPLLPCGWLYLFLIPAAGSGSPWGGALVMLTFGLGNVPALLGVALALRGVLGQARGRLRQATALLLIGTGALLVIHRGNVVAPALAESQAQARPAALAAPDSSAPPAPRRPAAPSVAEQERLPCCGGGGAAAVESGS